MTKRLTLFNHFMIYISHCLNFICITCVLSLVRFNLVPRVLKLFGQRLVARRHSGELEFYYRRISAVKQWKPLRSLYRAANQKFQFSRVSPGAYPLTKKPGDSGYEIASVFVGVTSALSVAVTINHAHEVRDTS